MEIYEVSLKAFLLQDIFKGQALERIAGLVDKSLCTSQNFLDFHRDNKFKNYTFNSLYKLERDGIYREGNIYSIKIRTIDKDLINHFNKNLANTYTEYIKGLTIESKVIARKPIEKIYSITPVVIKTNKGYWKKNFSIEDFEKRIRENLIKKYNEIFNVKLDENFELFNRIEFHNQKPISSFYKNIKILGDKLTLHVAGNNTAQELAYLSLGVGIGEMNSRGFGYVNWKSY